METVELALTVPRWLINLGIGSLAILATAEVFRAVATMIATLRERRETRGNSWSQ